MTGLDSRLSFNFRKWSRHAGFFLLAALVMFGTAAQADNTFLLQLGTFDSEARAKEKFDDVKSKNADVIGNLNLHIAEVALPPSNTTSYRTQVGPITSRDQAASICKSLTARDVECYVVETAMFGTGTDETPAITTKETTPEPEAAPTAPAPRHRAVAETAEDTSHADDPDYIPPPVDSGPVVISTEAAPSSISPAEVAEVSTPSPAPASVVARPAVVPAAPPAPVATANAEDATESSNNTPATNNHVVAGRGPRFLDEENQPTQKTPLASVAVAPLPTVTMAPAKPAESPGFFSRLFGEKPTPVASQGVVGSVNVSEAVRVPLTQENQPPRQKIVPVLPQVNALGGNPSESTAKTFWAQVSYFRDETQALSFYRQFSAAYPQYTDGVRIRITKPFAASAASGKVSLRVGPFAGTEDVRTICAVANRWNARCTVVRDIGASSSAVGTPAPARATTAKHAAEYGTYWAQLGTYHSDLEAWEAWKDLKEQHRKQVGRAKPTVTQPAASSAEGAVFRLRAGPYKTENAANGQCTRLQAVGVSCVVVGEH